MPKPTHLVCTLILAAPLGALDTGVLTFKGDARQAPAASDWRPYARALHTTLSTDPQAEDLGYEYTQPDLTPEGLGIMGGFDKHLKLGCLHLLDLRRPDEILDFRHITTSMVPLGSRPGCTRFVAEGLVLTGLFDGSLRTFSVNPGGLGLTPKDLNREISPDLVREFAVGPRTGSKVLVAALTPNHDKNEKALTPWLKVFSVDAVTGAIKDEGYSCRLAHGGTSVRWNQEGITFTDVDEDTGAGTLTLVVPAENKGARSLSPVWSMDITLARRAKRPEKEFSDCSALLGATTHIRTAPGKYLVGYLQGGFLKVDAKDAQPGTATVAREISLAGIGDFNLRGGLLSMDGIDGAAFFRAGADGSIQHLGNLANSTRARGAGPAGSFYATPLPAQKGPYDYFFTTSNLGGMSLVGYRKEPPKPAKADAVARPVTPSSSRIKP